MPWNDNANPGPWGSPPGSSNDEEPRAQSSLRPPSPPPPPPAGPNFGEALRRARSEWTRLTHSRRADRLVGRTVGLGVTSAAALWILSGFYVVQPYERAIVTRFGVYDRTDGPGFRYRLPLPIEQTALVDIANEQNLMIGGESGSERPAEGRMLTGDGNIVDLTFAVRFRIADPVAWLFQVRDPEEAVRAAGETAMREVVGRSALATVLSGNHADAQAQARGLTQQVLNRYHLGVVVEGVEIENASPPSEVAPAYQDVTRADADAKSAVNAANAYGSKTTGDAQAAAAKIALAASLYQQQVVHGANGEASRFNQIYDQYRRAPTVTRERLYTETMEDVLAHAHVVIVGAKGAQIIVSPQKPAPGASPATAATAGSQP